MLHGVLILISVTARQSELVPVRSGVPPLSQWQSTHPALLAAHVDHHIVSMCTMQVMCTAA